MSSNSDDGLSPGIVRVPVVFVNAYLVDVTPGEPRAGFVLVDSGLRGIGALEIQRAAAARYGSAARPRAIVLTHGHFDHAGSAAALAAHWRVPVYVHALELPYVTGRSLYPPADPTVGGALAMLSRTFARGGSDLRGCVQVLPEDGTVPPLPGWRAIPTPGHTAGHVSFWNEADGVLLAGDALATMNQESWLTTVTMRRELRWPPIPLTTDWDAARESVRALAALRPRTVAAGHGLPITGGAVPDALSRFAAGFARPSHGRYVNEPARADARGIISVPRPVPDPVGSGLWVVAGAAALGTMLVLTRREGVRR